jgi:hypothetical protein
MKIHWVYYILWFYFLLDTISCSLFLLISQYFSSNSIPIAFLFKFLAATSVVPEPQVKSKIISFSWVYVLIKYYITLNGFCVGCSEFGLPLEHLIIFIG